MRKLIAFSTLCLFCLLLKHEKGNCESSCQISCAKEVKPVLKNESTTDIEKASLKPYDGFFYKL